MTVQAYIFGGRSCPASLRLILQGVGQPNIDGSLFVYFYAFPLPRRGDRQHREQRPSLLCLSGACQVAASRRLIITSTIKRALQACDTLRVALTARLARLCGYFARCANLHQVHPPCMIHRSRIRKLTVTNRLRNSRPRCTAITAQGKRCAMVAARDGLCRYHHPALAVETHKNNRIATRRYWAARRRSDQK